MLKYIKGLKKDKKEDGKEDGKQAPTKAGTTPSTQSSEPTTTTAAATTDEQVSTPTPEIATPVEDARAQPTEEEHLGHEHSTHEHEHPPLSPVLDKDDESWLQSILDDDSPPPPLPARPKTPTIEFSESDAASSLADSDDVGDEHDKEGKETEKDRKKREKKEKKAKDKADKPSHRFSFFAKKKHGDTLKPDDVPPQEEEEREKKDLNRVLDRLNLSATNNKLMSMSSESSNLLQSFTQIFKDLANGVPTAVNDLTRLFDDHEGAINRGFEKLPSSLKKLVAQLPEKLTSSIAPELLAVAAESQGLKAETDAGIKEAAIKLLTPQNLTELVTKPGAMVSMLKAIVNALKLRWPAFVGTNVIASVALFILMFVLWYCHKRGREVRLEKEKATADADVIDGKDRITELPDDLLLPVPSELRHPAATSRVHSTDPSSTHPAAMSTKEPPPTPTVDSSSPVGTPVDTPAEPVSPLSVDLPPLPAGKETH